MNIRMIGWTATDNSSKNHLRIDYHKRQFGVDMWVHLRRGINESYAGVEWKALRRGKVLACGKCGSLDVAATKAVLAAWSYGEDVKTA